MSGANDLGVHYAHAYSRKLPPVVTSDVTSKSKPSSVAGTGSKPKYCGTDKSIQLHNVVLLGKVLINRNNSTCFSFVIFYCTKFGATITQLILGYVTGFLTGHVAVAPTSSILLSDATGSLATTTAYHPGVPF